jgi:hypothetical protein
VEGLCRQRYVLLLVGDAEEGDAMPDAVAQPTAWNRNA